MLHIVYTYSEETREMKLRIARLGVLVIAAAAMVGSMAPPAQANSVGAVAVQGVATVGAGLSYPCASAGGLDTTKCPVIGTGPAGSVEVTLPGGGQLVLPSLPPGGNTATVGFNGIGAGVLVNVAKSKCGAAPACVEAGTFNITGTGSVTGWCGLSDGRLAITVAPAIPVPGTKAKARTANVIFVGIGGALVITGITNKGEWVVGATLAVPNVSDGSSCTNKNLKTFLVAGAVALVR